MADVYGLMLAQVPLDNELLKASPVPDDGKQILFAAPSIPDCRVEIYSISVTYVTIPIDGTDAITGDIIVHDSSADSDTTLVDDFNFKSTNASLVANEAFTLWTGVQSLDPGDTVRLALTITTPDTAGQGALFTIAYRIKRYAGM